MSGIDMAYGDIRRMVRGINEAMEKNRIKPLPPKEPEQAKQHDMDVRYLFDTKPVKELIDTNIAILRGQL